MYAYKIDKEDDILETGSGECNGSDILIKVLDNSMWKLCFKASPWS